jgi:hypothetical protein
MNSPPVARAPVMQMVRTPPLSIKNTDVSKPVDLNSKSQFVITDCCTNRELYKPGEF